MPAVSEPTLTANGTVVRNGTMDVSGQCAGAGGELNVLRRVRTARLGVQYVRIRTLPPDDGRHDRAELLNRKVVERRVLDFIIDGPLPAPA